VQFTRDPGSLADARLEAEVKLPRELSHPKLIGGPKERHDSQDDQRAEPPRLPICRGDREIEHIALLVPHTAVVAGGHAETIVTWRKVGIERPTAVPRVSPIAIATLELVAEQHPLRSHQAQRGVIDLEVAHPGWQAHPARGGETLP